MGVDLEPRTICRPAIRGSGACQEVVHSICDTCALALQVLGYCGLFCKMLLQAPTQAVEHSMQVRDHLRQCNLNLKPGQEAEWAP